MGPRSGGHRRHRLGLRGRLACGAVRGFRWPELPVGERALAAHAAFASLRRRSGNRHRHRCSCRTVPAVRMGNGPGKLAARRPRRGGWSPCRLSRSQAHRPHLPRRSVAFRRRRNPTPWPPESPAPLRSAQKSPMSPSRRPPKTSLTRPPRHTKRVFAGRKTPKSNATFLRALQMGDIGDFCAADALLRRRKRLVGNGSSV